MTIISLGGDESYATRRLRYEAARRRIRFTALKVTDIALALQQKMRFADVLVVRTQQPNMIAHALTLARLYNAAGKRVIDAALAKDPTIYSKLNDLLVLAEHGIPTPHSLLAPPRQHEHRSAARRLGFPIVIKGIRGAGGKRVWRALNARDLERILRREPRGSLMLQEYIEAPYDFRVLVIGYRALPMILRRYPKRGDFRTNAKFAKRVETFSIYNFPKIKSLAERAARILKREFTGVDIRLRGTTPTVLEVNRQPEFRTFEKNTGLNVAGAFLDYATEKI